MLNKMCLIVIIKFFLGVHCLYLILSLRKIYFKLITRYYHERKELLYGMSYRWLAPCGKRRECTFAFRGRSHESPNASSSLNVHDREYAPVPQELERISLFGRVNAVSRAGRHVSPRFTSAMKDVNKTVTLRGFSSS